MPTGDPHDFSAINIAPDAKQTETTLPHHGFMGWVYAHPYPAVILAAGLLVVLGSLIVVRRSAVSPSGASAWGGGSLSVLDPTSYGQTPTPQPANTTASPVSPSPSSYIPIPTPSADTSSEGGTAAPDSFDFNAFMQLLSHDNGTTSSASANGDISNAFAFIPKGLISTSTVGVRRTAIQQALFDYGNDAGSYIQSFEQLHGNESQVLRDWAEDRQNADKTAAAVRIGNDLKSLGQTLAQESAPSAVVSLNAKLATSYVEIGEKLVAITKATKDSDFLAAINDYNAAADNFTKNYIALSDVFASYGVKFDQTDGGSVFTFSPVSL